MLRLDKATYLSLLFKFILSERLINSLWGSDVSVFSELMEIASVLFYNFVKFIILLYTFLAISFARYKEYEIYLILFSFQMYYLLLLVRVLLVIFAAFV